MTATRYLQETLRRKPKNPAIPSAMHHRQGTFCPAGSQQADRMPARREQDPLFTLPVLWATKHPPP